MQVTNDNDLSSAHVTFASADEAKYLGERGFLQRTDQQFHWNNDGYANFEAFLAALSSRKRKTIRRERKEALSAGIDVHCLTGSDLTEGDWDAFFAFYMETGSRKWGRPYLTREFFSIVGAAMGERILLVMARRNGRWIAGAINFIGPDAALWPQLGRARAPSVPALRALLLSGDRLRHCHGLKRVEAGAQGEHKLARGYLPVTTYSAHYIANPALRRAVADYLKRERAYVDAAGRELAAAAPFRKDLAEQDQD